MNRILLKIRIIGRCFHRERQCIAHIILFERKCSSVTILIKPRMLYLRHTIATKVKPAMWILKAQFTATFCMDKLDQFFCTSQGIILIRGCCNTLFSKGIDFFYSLGTRSSITSSNFLCVCLSAVRLKFSSSLSRSSVRTSRLTFL